MLSSIIIGAWSLPSWVVAFMTQLQLALKELAI